MKVWITRPECDEVYMGGLRNVLVWVAKPFFDQRPIKEIYELYHVATQAYGSTVWMEGGWTSSVVGVRAKPFLKQNEAVMDRVWDMIRESLVSGKIAPDDVTDIRSADILLDTRYEAKCAVHWKRFLLEIDLLTEVVSHTSVRVVMPEGDEGIDLPLTEGVSTTSYFLDEDLSKPFQMADGVAGFELRNDRIW